MPDNIDMSLSHSLLHFPEVDKYDSYHVGVRAGSIGELVQAGFPVPDGFIISATAYFTFLKEHNLTTKINHLLKTINYNEPNSLIQVSTHIRKLIRETPLSDKLAEDIFSAYRKLGGVVKNPVVVIRSSVTSDNLPSPIFAGQSETFINITGESTVLMKVKDAWASLFEPRAIYYRQEKRFDHFRVGLAVIVQKMVYAEKSGILFSIDPLTGNKQSLVIEAMLGLRETSRSEVLPHDRYAVDKRSVEIIEKRISEQRVMREKIGTKLHTIRVPEAKAHQSKLTGSEIKALTELGKKLEQHYYFPVEIEWAIEKGTISIISLKHLTLIPEAKSEQEKLLPTLTYQKGIPLTRGMASGHIRHIKSQDDLKHIVSGEVLLMKEVTRETLPLVKRAYAVVTEKYPYPPDIIQQIKLLGLPFITGVKTNQPEYKNGSVLTVNAETGELTPGGLFNTHAHKKLPVATAIPEETATKIFLSLQKPDTKDRYAHVKSDGVGMLNGNIFLSESGIHPKKLIRDGKKQETIKQLVTILEDICREFYPRPVIYKLSDFTSDAFREMLGGKGIEPIEKNPDLGYHGGYRIIHDPTLFNLEIEAISRTRNKHGMTNLWLMLPFLRSHQELERIKKMLHEHSGFRSRSFKLWMSVDTPTNVVLIDSFIKSGIDGVSLHADSLTMLFTGTDPNNSEVAPLFSREHEAVLQAYQYVIKRCHKHNIPTSLYGSSLQPTPSLIEKLVGWGIASITIQPDTLENVRKTIYKYERKLVA